MRSQQVFGTSTELTKSSQVTSGTSLNDAKSDFSASQLNSSHNKRLYYVYVSDELILLSCSDDQQWKQTNIKNIDETFVTKTSPGFMEIMPKGTVSFDSESSSETEGGCPKVRYFNFF